MGYQVCFNRPRPFAADKRIKFYVPKPESPSYPCEHSVAAGVAVAIISHFFPSLADSVNRMAQQGWHQGLQPVLLFPVIPVQVLSWANESLKKKLNTPKIFHKSNMGWKDSSRSWFMERKGPMFPLGRTKQNRSIENGSEFRPGPPPDFAKEMAELKNYKQTFRSMSNAYYWASQDFWVEMLHKKIFEYNLHLNPPRAARLYAITAVGIMMALLPAGMPSMLTGVSALISMILPIILRCQHRHFPVIHLVMPL